MKPGRIVPALCIDRFRPVRDLNRGGCSYSDNSIRLDEDHAIGDGFRIGPGQDGSINDGRDRQSRCDVYVLGNGRGRLHHGWLRLYRDAPGQQYNNEQ